MEVSLFKLALITIFNNGINAKLPSKVVGGYPIDITDAPYMVRVHRRVNSTQKFICDGTIISNWHVLTAAHCIENSTDRRKVIHPIWFEVIAGELFNRPGIELYAVEKLYLHPNYTPPISGDSTREADIAVIKLTDEISFGPTRGSIQLATEMPLSNAIGFGYGWGSTHPNIPRFSHILKQVMLKVHNSRDFAILYPNVPFAGDGLYTKAVWLEGGMCNGDSGGPLVVDRKLIGVFSSSIDCDLGYFVSVMHHKSWIEDAVNGTAKAVEFTATDVADIIYNMQALHLLKNLGFIKLFMKLWV